jgi:hypothetical protein
MDNGKPGKRLKLWQYLLILIAIITVVDLVISLLVTHHLISN